MKNRKKFFDSGFNENEQLPRKFAVNFDSVEINSKSKVKVSINDIQVGDFIDDNSKIKDFYRFHDVFHYTFAALLGWSPCTRAMLKVKRKSNPSIDEIEDGARAAITEEAISLIVFNEAKRNDFFMEKTKVSLQILNQIKEMTNSFEVSAKSKKEWENVILKGYSLFNDLVKNNGGIVHFDMVQGTAVFRN